MKSPSSPVALNLGSAKLGWEESSFLWIQWKNRSGISSHIHFFSLFHGTKIGLNFNLLLLLWLFHQHFTRLLKKPWNLYLTWSNCGIYCLGIFYLMILENKLFTGLYFSAPVMLCLGMFSPGWCLLGNKLEKILKTLTPSSAHNRVGQWSPSSRKRFFFSTGNKRFCPITNTDPIILAMTMKNKNFRAHLELFHKKVNKLKEEV